MITVRAAPDTIRLGNDCVIPVMLMGRCKRWCCDYRRLTETSCQSRYVVHWARAAKFGTNLPPSLGLLGHSIENPRSPQDTLHHTTHLEATDRYLQAWARYKQPLGCDAVTMLIISRLVSRRDFHINCSTFCRSPLFIGQYRWVSLHIRMCNAKVRER